jgi:hypothetical protein
MISYSFLVMRILYKNGGRDYLIFVLIVYLRSLIIKINKKQTIEKLLYVYNLKVKINKVGREKIAEARKHTN